MNLDQRLIAAVKANDLALATELIAAGADVNARIRSGIRPSSTRAPRG